MASVIDSGMTTIGQSPCNINVLMLPCTRRKLLVLDQFENHLILHEIGIIAGTSFDIGDHNETLP